MKKLFLLLIIILSLFGCDNNIYYWEFKCGYEEFSQIKIVEMIDYLDYREIQEIDLSLAEDVYTDIVSIEMKRYGPNLSSPSEKCFLIVFENGEYDIISKTESMHFKYHDEDILGYNSWLYCDKNEFDELINKYLTNK